LAKKNLSFNEIWYKSIRPWGGALRLHVWAAVKGTGRDDEYQEIPTYINACRYGPGSYAAYQCSWTPMPIVIPISARIGSTRLTDNPQICMCHGRDRTRALTFLGL
jgi:hypothetical protein